MDMNNMTKLVVLYLLKERDYAFIPHIEAIAADLYIGANAVKKAIDYLEMKSYIKRVSYYSTPYLNRVYVTNFHGFFESMDNEQIGKLLDYTKGLLSWERQVIDEALNCREERLYKINRHIKKYYYEHTSP